MCSLRFLCLTLLKSCCTNRHTALAGPQTNCQDFAQNSKLFLCADLPPINSLLKNINFFFLFAKTKRIFALRIRFGITGNLQIPDGEIIQVILFEIDCAIFYTNLHELFFQSISWTKWVNSGIFMDNCWISCQVMAEMKRVFDDLIFINLYYATIVPSFQISWMHTWIMQYFEVLEALESNSK